MRSGFGVLLSVMLIAGTLSAQTEDRRDHIQAALNNAAASLRQQVEGVRLSNDLTVGQLVNQLQAQEQLNNILSRAQQIGGTRWLDDQTCQVRLELAGNSVSAELKRLVSSAKKPPVS